MISDSLLVMFLVARRQGGFLAQGHRHTRRRPAPRFSGRDSLAEAASEVLGQLEQTGRLGAADAEVHGLRSAALCPHRVCARKIPALCILAVCASNVVSLSLTRTICKFIISHDRKGTLKELHGSTPCGADLRAQCLDSGACAREGGLGTEAKPGRQDVTVSKQL